MLMYGRFYLTTGVLVLLLYCIAACKHYRAKFYFQSLVYK